MARGVLLPRGSNWRRFWQEFWDELYSKFKGHCEEESAGYVMKRLLERLKRDPGDAAERSGLGVPDLSSFGEFLFEKIVRAPRSPPPFLLADGNETARLPSFAVDHIPVPDNFFYPTDAGLILVPEFADRQPRLGPILHCGSRLFSRDSKTTPSLPLLLLPPPPGPPNGDGPPDPPRGPSWVWVALGVSATAVVVTLALLARRRRARRRAAQLAAEEEASRLAQEARRRAAQLAAEEEASRLAQEARRRASQLAAEEEARRLAQEARRRAAQLAAEEEARRLAQEARRRASQLAAEEEARRSEDQARRNAEALQSALPASQVAADEATATAGIPPSWSSTSSPEDAAAAASPTTAATSTEAASSSAATSTAVAGTLE